MPLNLGTRPGTLGKCRRHNEILLPRKREDLAERIATEQAAEESRARLAAEGLPMPADSAALRRARKKPGYCPKCVAEEAAAAVAYLHGANA